MLARRLEVAVLAGWDPDALEGAILLAPVMLPNTTLRKGTRLDFSLATRLIEAARTKELERPVRAGWPEPGDLHEDAAAERLASVSAGHGLVPQPPHQSRLDLAARWAGVLHVQVAQLLRLNAVDSLELFTLLHGQAVEAGQVVASVKVAPHILPAALLDQGLRIAAEYTPLVDVLPYQQLEVAALAAEAITGAVLTRFEAGVRRKVEALGSIFVGTTVLSAPEADKAQREARGALQALALDRGLPVLLVGGVSAGDPLSPFYTALEELGGRVVRHGVPAHPGSMIWLAELGDTKLLGLPQCGMFAMATAADLILPRLLTGERLTAESLAELAHGGVLGREMRFRFPPYARDLEAPE